MTKTTQYHCNLCRDPIEQIDPTKDKRRYKLGVGIRWTGGNHIELKPFLTDTEHHICRACFEKLRAAPNLFPLPQKTAAEK